MVIESERVEVSLSRLMKHKYFTKADKNHDGLLDADELQATFKKRFDAVTTIGQMNRLIAKFDQDNKEMVSLDDLNV